MRNVPILATSCAPWSMNAGIALNGTEISWLETEPTRRFASGIISRMVQKSFACWLVCAISPSGTNPASCAAAKSVSSAASGSRSPLRPTSINTHHSGAVAKGCRTSGNVWAKKSNPCRWINSNALTISPRCARANDSKSSAARGSVTTSIAVPVRAGFGNSLSAAAVITPNVPSAPISKCRRS